MHDLLFRIGSVAALLVFGMSSTLEAQPVILHFEATVTAIQGDLSQLDVPFTLGAGESIAGELSFASEDDLQTVLLGGPNGRSSIGTLRLDIGGVEVGNAFNFGSVNQPPVDINNPPPGPKSAISFAWIPPTDAIPGWAGQAGSVIWSAGILLVGMDGIIDDPNAVPDFNTWNALDETRLLTMAFGFPDTIVVQATLGDFIVVPEPASSLLASALTLLAAMGRMRTRRS